MPRVKTAKYPTPDAIEPEEESRDYSEEPEVDEEPGSAEVPKAGGKAISKAEAVRDALAHGEDSPEEGTRYIKNTHGIDITRQMFSSYKAQQKARDAKKQGDAEPAPAAPTSRKRAATIDGFLSSPSMAHPADNNLIESLEALKPLIAQYGPDKVKRLVDLLG